MRALARLWGAGNGSLISNALSMLGAAVVTSGFGAAFWLLAARLFPGAAVGFAGASISAMTLLGNAGMLGLGTLLIGELPRQPGEETGLIATALVATGVAGAGLGILFVLTAPIISHNFSPLAAGIATAGLFMVGVALTSITAVLDQALIGLLRGSLQFGRNAVFAATKLGALVAVGTWLGRGTGNAQWLTIYATWLFGNVASLLVLIGFLVLRGGGSSLRRSRARRDMLRRFGVSALRHHWLNLALQAPGFALPLVVTALLSSTENAYFYVASMVASLVFYGPLALVTALYAVGTRSPAALAARMRFTLGLALAGGVLVDAVLFVGADRVLSLFGGAYAAQAAWTLRLLGLGVFPIIIKDHFVAISRIRGKILGTALLATSGGVLELGLAAAGGIHSGRLSGLALGWLAALCIEAACMMPTVIRALNRASDEVPASSAEDAS